MPNNSRVTPASGTTCYTFKKLYDRVRSRPFNQPFALRYIDGSVDAGLNSEEAMKDSLRAHGNSYLKLPVVIEW
ncbi:hypothetical protein [Idiomarina aminovorans]|uniref:hypothetical protein n=1 Tax=Idiomarina aminovorans TaxID=2914829 RepID=UPI002004B77E|nr:hypothetical protein [Idiomarina sp. ATCH4]MCK7460536.1 hypothetical protein [Idiomarina sp. ATCH4]